MLNYWSVKEYLTQMNLYIFILYVFGVKMHTCLNRSEYVVYLHALGYNPWCLGKHPSKVFPIFRFYLKVEICNCMPVTQLAVTLLPYFYL
jgi:hypothetical protein